MARFAANGNGSRKGFACRIKEETKCQTRVDSYTLILPGGGVILLVVLGHLVPFGELVWLWIFAFHMPFFFIMSGYCSGENNYKLSFRKFFLKYAKALLLPSVVIRVVLVFSGVSGIDLGSATGAADSFRYMIAPLSEWFIMSLFASKLLSYWVIKAVNLIEDRRVQAFIASFVIGLAFYVGETWRSNGLHGKSDWFPVPIDCSLIALSFVLTGYLCRKARISEIYEKYRKLALSAGTLAVLVIMWLIRFQTYTNVCEIHFGNSSIGYFAFACILSFYFLMVCKWFSEKVRERNLFVRALRVFGANTILVYPGHTILFFWLNEIIYRITGIQYVPMIDFRTSLIFVYFAITVIVFLPICSLKEKLMPMIKRKMNRKPKNILVPAVLIVAVLGSGCFGLDAVASAVGEQSGTYEICSVEDFLRFRDNVNAGTDYAGCTVVQSADLDLSSVDNFVPIGLFDSGNYFCGTYDGQGHSIRNIRIESEGNAALFPVLGGTVCNLKIESGKISGAFVGSFASHATTSGTARIVNCINQADVFGFGRAGGIADNFNGRILNCVNTGKVESASGAIGGIVSCSAMDIQNSFSDINPLYPSDISFQSNHTIGREDADFSVAHFNLLLGEMSVAENLSLVPIDRTADGFVFLENIPFEYSAGKLLFFVNAYWVDVVLWLLMVLAAVKTVKAYREYRSSLAVPYETMDSGAGSSPAG